MSNLASLNVKIDRDLKKDADSIANAMGMTLSTAINIFVRKMVAEKAIPFKVQISSGVPSPLHITDIPAFETADTWDEFDNLVDSMTEKPKFEDFPRNTLNRDLINFERV